MTVLFECDFEDNKLDKFYVSNNGIHRCYVTSDLAHSGRRCAATWVTPVSWLGANAGVRLSYMAHKDTPPDIPDNLPDTATYSAWYYLQRPYKTNWSVIMQWKQIRPTTFERDPTLLIALIGDGTQMAIKISSKVGDDGQYRLGAGVDLAMGPMFVPIGKWFELKTTYTWSWQTTGSVTSYLDGELLWDIRDIRTEFDRPFISHPRQVVWGNYAEYTWPSSLGVYIDDVKIEVE